MRREVWREEAASTRAAGALLPTARGRRGKVGGEHAHTSTSAACPPPQTPAAAPDARTSWAGRAAPPALHRQRQPSAVPHRPPRPRALAVRLLPEGAPIRQLVRQGTAEPLGWSTHRKARPAVAGAAQRQARRRVNHAGAAWAAVGRPLRPLLHPPTRPRPTSPSTAPSPWSPSCRRPPSCSRRAPWPARSGRR